MLVDPQTGEYNITHKFEFPQEIYGLLLACLLSCLQTWFACAFVLHGWCGGGGGGSWDGGC